MIDTTATIAPLTALIHDRMSVARTQIVIIIIIITAACVRSGGGGRSNG
jgi:hypothetical protein